MISGFILLEIAATIALIYGFTQEEKIIQFEDQIIKKIVKAVRK
jgi:type III secretory pathway component EscS